MCFECISTQEGAKKMVYYVSEVTVPNSFAKAEQINAKTRTSAKRSASRYQMFQNTVIYLGREVNDKGFIINPIAVKKGNKWLDLDL